MTVAGRVLSSGTVPSTPLRPVGRRHWLFPAGLMVFAALWLVFFPRTFAIVDEDAYLTQALLLRQGRLTYEDSGIPAPHMTVEQAGRLASKYPPGNSLLIVPFTLLGWRGAFLLGLVLALLGAWLFRKVLAVIEPGADPAWALLYLFYPTVVLYSRTLMSDLAAATAVLAGLLMLLNRRFLAAGLLVGLACLTRYSNAVLAAVFAGLIVMRGERRVRSLLLFLLGLAPFGVAALAYNWWCYGGPLNFPMYWTGRLHPVYFWRNLGFYLPNLLLCYPLMLLAPWFVRHGYRWHVVLPAYAVLLLYSFFSALHPVPSIVERVVVWMRYLLLGLPFFVLGYAVVLDRLARELRGMAWIRYPVVALLVVGAAGINWRHSRLLSTQAEYQDLLYAAVPPGALLVCDRESSELVTYARGARDWRHYVEFNIPLPLDREIAARDTVYAALLVKPGRDQLVDRAVFWSLVGPRRLNDVVVLRKKPWRLLVCRLRPPG